MITQGLFDIFYGLLSFFVGLIPVFDLPAQLLGAVTGFLSFFHSFSYFVPLGTFFTCVILTVGVDFTFFAIWLVNWVVHRLPIVG